jgi:hypothetical protein
MNTRIKKYMITTTQVLLGAFVLMLFIIIVMLATFWFGANVFHKGVMLGLESKSIVSDRVPEGEVFRLSGTDELPEEPLESNELDKTTAARAERFLSTLIGKV